MLSRIERALGAWGHFVYRHAVWVIALLLLLTAGLATQLSHFHMDASTEGYFHQNDPIRIQYDRFRSQFGRDTLILVALRPRAGIFDLDFLARLRSLHDEIESEVPLLVEVTSLINARDTRGLEDGLEVGELFEDWPETQAELDVIRDRALSNPLYPNYLISESRSITTILIETEVYSQAGVYDELEGFGDEESGDEADEPVPMTGEEDLAIALALYEVLDRYRSDELEIHSAGMTVFNSMLNQRMAGHLPMLFHPSPKRALNIGLGCGITFGALSVYPLDECEGIEIEPATLEIAGLMQNFNHQVLDNPGLSADADADSWNRLTMLRLLSLLHWELLPDNLPLEDLASQSATLLRMLPPPPRHAPGGPLRGATCAAIGEP